METWLKSINSVVGVTGSFIARSDGSIAAKVVPASLEDVSVQLSARIISQTFFAFETTGQHVSEVDLAFGRGRLVLRDLHGGVLVILCARNINVALLNLTVNGAVKKLTAALKQQAPTKAAHLKAPSATEPVAPPASVPAASPANAQVAEPIAPSTPIQAASPVTAPKVAEPVIHPTPVVVTRPESKTEPAIEKAQDANPVLPSPLFVELEQEVNRLHDMSQREQIALYALEPVAFWERCPQSRRLVAPPRKRYLSFLATQGVSIRSLFVKAGYQPVKHTYTGLVNRLSFYDAARNLTADVHLDVIEMYHSLDLAELFDFGRFTMADIFKEKTLPETYLALIRLQLVEMTDTALSDLSALFLDHKVSVEPEPRSINAIQIAKLCADEWPWYKTITMNLDRLIAFAQDYLSTQDQTVVVERTRMLRQTIESKPKSLRWRTRAIRGESVKWYETPQTSAAP